MRKTYLVFGAGGSVGREVVYQLLSGGHRVLAVIRKQHQKIREQLLRDGADVEVIDDVGNRLLMEKFSAMLFLSRIPINGIVYSVGHCPPNGFVDAIKYPLSQLDPTRYENEINMHQIGVLNVYQCMRRNLVSGGCFVFMSSTITRLKGNFPPFLQAHYHASVMSAEDWLVEGMRHDPTTAERRIKVHRVAPGAVDTPFHQGEGPKPPRLTSIYRVVKEVVRALNSEDDVDITL